MARTNIIVPEIFESSENIKNKESSEISNGVLNKNSEEQIKINKEETGENNEIHLDN